MGLGRPQPSTMANPNRPRAESSLPIVVQDSAVGPTTILRGLAKSIPTRPGLDCPWVFTNTSMVDDEEMISAENLRLEPLPMSKSKCAILVLTVLASVLTVTAEQFDSAGAAISFADVGDKNGEPVVSLHGWLGDGGQMVSHPTTKRLVKGGFRVIAPDLRGHGASDKPQHAADYGVHMVEDVVRLMDHLGIESAQFMGYSMGGMIVTKLMVDHPERVRSAVVGGNGGVRANYDSRFFDSLAVDVEHGAKFGDAMIDRWELLGAAPLTDDHKRVIRGLNLLARADAKALAEAAISWKQLAVSASQLQRVQTPTLVIYGEHELPENIVFAKEMTELVPDCRSKTIAGATHMDAYLTPEYASTVCEFVEQKR
jgi:pimeloyl-ACP methyl ester carboxylesterase